MNSMKNLVNAALRFVYARPRLRLAYWFVRAPFSPYAAYCFAKESAARALLTDGQYRVLHGPYKGMIYTRHGSSVQLPCLLGTYEMEIWPVIESLKTSKYDLVIDVGCAEGYHACGIASTAGIKVDAYDTSDLSRRDCAEMVRLNDLGNLVTIKSFLTHEELQSRCANGRIFVFCDIDFAEAELLDLDRVPALAHADLLVETHGFRPGGPEDTLPLIRKRFERTHDITVFPMQSRLCHDMWDFVDNAAANKFAIGILEDEPLGLAFFEVRPFNNWLWLKSKSRS